VNPYVPILVLGAISAGFAVFSIGAGALSGPKRYNRAKLDAYECGIEPTPHAAGGGRFPVKYYLVAMLFIVFDIESVFLIPYAVAFDQLKLFGLVEMVSSSSPCSSPTPTSGDAAAWSGTDGPADHRKGVTWVSRRSCRAASC